jgi:hypothetical protein
LVSVSASDTTLIPAENLQLRSLSGARTLVITPAAGLTGRAWVTVEAQDNRGKSAQQSFPIVVGRLDDLDLDGVPNHEEDAAPEDGDFNGDGILDSHQAHVASVRSTDGTSFIQLVVPEGHLLARVQTTTSPEPTGVAADADFPLGLVQFDVHVPRPADVSEVRIRHDSPNATINRYFQHGSWRGGAPKWHFRMHDQHEGARVYADHVQLTVADGGWADHIASPDSRISAYAGLAQVEFPWQNLMREDVDNNGIVTPFDVLGLINQINSRGSRELGSMPAGADSVPLFLDPTGNNSLEPVDALLVINYLNNPPPGIRGGEGEMGWPTSASPLTLSEDALAAARPGHRQRDHSPLGAHPEQIPGNTAERETTPTPHAAHPHSNRVALIDRVFAAPEGTGDDDLLLEDWARENERTANVDVAEVAGLPEQAARTDFLRIPQRRSNDPH